MSRVRPPSRPASSPGTSIEQWVDIPDGTFVMGSDRYGPEEAPAHPVHVDGFAISRWCVTNAEFAEFVAATGYVTVAERPLDPADFPGAPPANLVPGSLVFSPTPGPVDLRHLSQWWVWTPGASWRHPEGLRSSIDQRCDHPVVHVAYDDAVAYARWARADLPTEAEWERAARGGLDQADYTWGSEPSTSEQASQLANIWAGTGFPWRRPRGPGTWERTAPVGSYPPNGFGLYDMAGNVWEWTSDWWTDRHPAATGSACCAPNNPRGGSRQGSFDRAQPQFPVPRKVLKGGSFLCADTYCHRYRPAARRPQMVDTGMSHIGFRVVRRTSRADGGTTR